MSDKKKDLLTKKLDVGVQKPPHYDTCGLYALRAPTIITNHSHIVVLTPYFYAHIGAGHKVILPLVCEPHVVSDLLPLVSKIKI